MKTGFVLLLLVLAETALYAQEFMEDSEKDFPLRSKVQLQVSNTQGDLFVQGWSLDNKIRVKARKRVVADKEAQAKPLFSGVEYSYRSSDENIEITSQYGASLSIEDRLQEKEHPRIHMDLTLFVPSKLKLQIWAVEGKVTLRNWNAPVEIRSNRGAIHIDSINTSLISLLCPSCSVQARNIFGSLRCIGGSGLIDLSRVSAKDVYVETDSGGIKLAHVEGNQLYVSKTGNVDGQFLSGKVQFSAHQTSIDFKEVSGLLSGRVEKGNVTATFKDQTFSENALIEAIHGNVSLTLPRRFSSEVDLWSVQGTTQLDFSLQRSEDARLSKRSANRLVVRVGDGGELLKVFSETGNIHLTREHF